jgi:rare lipoprotein A
MTHARAAVLLPLIILFVGVVPHPVLAQSSGGANQTCKEWWAANKDKPQAMVTPPKCQENVSCNGSIGTVSGRCVQDKCKADTACGKPLEGKPDENVQSGGAPQQGQQGSQSGSADSKIDSLQRDLANTPLGQEFQNIFDQLEAPDTPTQLTAPGSQSALESLSRWQSDALNAVSDITGATVNPINTIFGQMQQYLQNPVMSSPPQGWSFSPSPSGGPGSFSSSPAPSAGGGTFSNPWSSMAENLPGAQSSGSVIGDALVSAQEAAANAWQAVKEYSAAAWEKTMAALTPAEEALPGAGLPDSPNMTPEQELPGIEVEQTPSGLPQNVAELAEQLDSPVVAEQVRNNYVEEILASKDEGWTPSQQQVEAARSIARENVQSARAALSGRNGFEAWADQFITASQEQRDLNTAIAQEQALAQMNRENFRSDAYLLQPNQAQQPTTQPSVTGTQGTPNPQLARRLENIGGIADEAKTAEKNYIEAMERAGLVQCKSPCSNVDPQYEAVQGLSDAERQRLAARVAPEREAYEKALAKYTDYEKATEQAFLEERRAAGATETFTAQTRAERATQLELVGQRDPLTVDANEVFTSTAVTEFGSSLVQGEGISKFEITPAAEQRVLAKLYAASDQRALEYESCTSNCGQIAEAMRRTEGYIQQIERGEYTDTGLRSLLVKESNQNPNSFGQSFRETQAALGQAMGDAWAEAGNASTLGGKISGYAKAAGYFAVSLPGQLTGSALGQTSTDFGLELMTGYGYGGLTGATGYEFLDIVEAGSAYAVPFTGVYTFASPVRALENGIGSAFSAASRGVVNTALPPGSTLGSISGSGFAGNFSALPSVTPSALPAGAALPSPVTSVTPSVTPSQITPSNIAPVRAANSVPSYVNAIARAIDPSNTPSAASAPVAPVLRSVVNDVARASSDISSDVSSAGRLANVFNGTPAGASYNEAAQLGRQAATRYSGVEQALRQAVEAPSAPVTTTQRLLADLTEAENLRAAAAARLAQADAVLAQESLTLLDEVVPQDIPVVTSRTAPFIISDTPIQRSLGSAVAFAPETGVGAAPLPVRSPFQVGPALKQSGDAIADLQNAGTRHGVDISITPAQPVTRPASLDYHGLDAEVRGEFIKSSLDNAADGAVEWLNRPMITEAKRLDGAPLSTRERMALRTELEGALPQANELYEANKLRANSIAGFGGHLQNVSRFLAPIDTPAANALKKLYDPNLFPAGRAYDELPLTDKLALTQRIDGVARQYLDIVSGRLPNTAAAASSDIAPLARREISQAQANAMQNLADRHGMPLDNDFITKHWITDDIDSQSSAAKVFRDLVEGSSADQALVRAAANGDVDGLLAEIGNRMGAPQYVQPKPTVAASDGVLSRLAKPLRPLVLGLSMILNPISPSSIPGLGIFDNAITSPSPAAASEASRRGMSAARQAPLLGQEREIVASFYGNPGDATAGSRITSSGAIYDPDGLSIAHRDLRLGTKVLLDDGVHQPIVARVTNRGPFVKGRDVDLSYQAAKHFESTSKGVTHLKMTVLDNPPDSVAYSFSKGRTDFNDGSVVTRESAQTLVAQAQNAPSAPPVRVAEAAPIEQNVVVTPDEIVNRSLTADHPARAPVGAPQLEAINPLNEVDDFFGRIFTPTEQGVKDIVNQVIKQNPYIARTKLAAQVLKEQPSAVGTSAYKKLRDNVARELTGRRDGQGGVSAAEAARADAEIARQLAVLNGELQPQRTIGEIAKMAGRPEIPGLEGKGHFMVPLQSADALPKRVAIIMHQTEGSYAVGHARAQMSRPNKVGTTIWVERDGTFYWSAPENANPKHIRGGSGLRGDNKYIDNSQTRGVIDNNNTIGIEFAGNPPGRLQNPLTPEQLDTAAKLGRFLQERYNIPSDKIYAHSWVQHKAESSARVGDRYVEGAAAANMVRMLGYRPGIDSAIDFTGAADRALVNTAMANLPTGGPMDATVRTALRDTADGVLVADNVPAPATPENTFVETAFNRASPFNVLPAETAEQVVRNFTTPSVLDNASPLDVRPAPVLVSEPAPVARPTAPTQVAANEPTVVPTSASQPRGYGLLDAVIEAPIWIGNGVSAAVDSVSNVGTRIRNALGGTETVARNTDTVTTIPLQEQVVVSNEPGGTVRPSESPTNIGEAPIQSVDTVPPATLPVSDQPIALARVPLVEGEMIRPSSPTSIALNASNRLGDEIVQVSEQPIQIVSKTVRVEDISGADATAVASADVKGALAGVEAAEARAVAAKVFLTELDTSKRLADNVNRLMSAYFNQGKVLDPQSLSSAIQKSVAQVNRFERALADAEAAGALDAATASRVRELFTPVKNTSQLLDTQRPQLMRLVPNSHGKVSLGATFGIDGAAEGLQAIRTTPARLSASLAERQALETAARTGAEKTIAAADAARAEAKRIAEAEQLRLVEQAKIAEARAAQIVNQQGPVAYVPPATPGTWTSAEALAAPKGPFEVTLVPKGPSGDIPTPTQPPSDPFVLPVAVRRDQRPSDEVPQPVTDPALTPPPIPTRLEPELPFPENTGATPNGEISPTLTADGGPVVSPQTQTVSPYARLRNWVSEKVADYRRNRLAAGTGPTENLTPMSDGFAQRLDEWSRSEAPRLQQAEELGALEEGMRARQQLAARNAADLAAVTPEPQQGIPSVRDTELANAKKEMSTALTRFDESAQDLARAEEAFARNTPEGDVEARALAASGLEKAREGATAESRALTIVRANTDVPTDDMIGRLRQWDARYAGSGSAADGGSGGAGGSGGSGTAGNGDSASSNNNASQIARSVFSFLCGGPKRAIFCGAVGIGLTGATYNEYQTQTASSDSGEVTLGNIPTDMPGSVVAVPGTQTRDGNTPIGTQSDTRTSTDQSSDPGTPPGTGDASGAGAPRGGDGYGGGGGAGSGGSGGSMGSGGGFFGGGMNLLSGLFQGFMQWLTGEGEEEDRSGPQQPATATPEPPVGAIVGNPQIVDAGDTTTISWSTVGTDVSSSTCAVVTADFAVFARGGQNGSISSGVLSESTRFGLVCNVKGAQDKLLNETLIRVRGDDTDPPRIFTDEQIAASQASSGNPIRPTQGSNAQTGSNSAGASGSPAPEDVRTCDPEQPMDSFIRCLCEAEPNPRGCSVPPGGLRQ